MKHLKDYITVNGQEYYVSTKNTFDVGFETMVFKSKDKCVVDWVEEYYKHYAAEGEAIKGHNYIVNNLEKCLEEGNAQDWQSKTEIDVLDEEYILKLLKEIKGEMNKYVKEIEREVNKYE